MERERTCCDGLCQHGGRCPAFAPGVIDGPHRRPGLRAWLRGAWRAVVHVLLAILIGPRL